jgi:hypothetical protein
VSTLRTAARDETADATPRRRSVSGYTAPRQPATTELSDYAVASPGDGWVQTGDTRYVVDRPAVAPTPEIPERSHPEWIWARTSTALSDYAAASPGDGWVQTVEVRTVVDVPAQPAQPAVPAVTHQELVDPGQPYLPATYTTVVDVPAVPAVPAVPVAPPDPRPNQVTVRIDGHTVRRATFGTTFVVRYTLRPGARHSWRVVADGWRGAGGDKPFTGATSPTCQHPVYGPGGFTGRWGTGRPVTVPAGTRIRLTLAVTDAAGPPVPGRVRFVSDGRGRWHLSVHLDPAMRGPVLAAGRRTARRHHPYHRDLHPLTTTLGRTRPRSNDHGRTRRPGRI